MPLQPKVKLSYLDGKYVLTETTGAYHETDNPGGWGEPNVRTSSVISAGIIIVDSEAVEHEFDIIPQLPDVVEGSFELNVGSLTLPDGISEIEYEIEYEVEGDDNETATYCTTVAFFPDVKCCIHKLIKELPNKDPDNPEDLVFIHSVLEADAMLLGLTTSALSLSTEKINTILTALEQICDYYNGQYGCGCS